MQLIDAFELDRRGLVASIAALIGATSLPEEAFAVAPKGKAPAGVLTPAQFATLTAIADTVIPVTDTPGAVAAGVPRIIDGMLRNWASADSKTKILGAIAAVEKIAMDADKKGFTALTPARRKELLLGFDKTALALGPKPEKPQNAFEAMIMGPPVMNPGWRKVKDLVINIYYNSQIACTKELIYEHVPGKWVPSLKVTPDTRPWASAGPF